MVKMRIGNKILITYLLILLVVFLTINISFNLLSKIYLIREAKLQLKEEGRIIAETLKRLNLEEGTVRERLLDRQKLKLAGRFIDSEIIVFNNDRKIIYKDINSIDPKTLVKILRRDDLKNLEGYVFEVTPIFDNRNEIKGYVLLLTRAKNINGLNSLFKNARRISFLIAGILAFITGIIFSRSLTKPIKKLSKKMESFSIKEFNDYEQIKTGDEIEELDKSFKEMAEKIRNYDERQKKIFSKYIP